MGTYGLIPASQLRLDGESEKYGVDARPTHYSGSG